MNTFTIKNNLIFKTLLLKGMDGATVVSMEKTSTEGLVDTYTITYSDGTTEAFTVTNGRGISRIDKTDTNVLTDTYTITYNDGTTSTYTVNNGRGITSVDKTSSTGLTDTYTITYNDNTTSTFTIKNGLTTGLSDAQGEPLNVGNTQTPTYFSNGVPVATDMRTDIADETKVPATWTSVSGISGTFRDITYGNGLFVANYEVLSYHELCYSVDGINWTPSINNTTNVQCIAYGNGMFVASGQNTYHSIDGKTWTAGGQLEAQIGEIAYGNGIFVTVGTSGHNYHTTDGSTWTAGNNAGSNFLNGIAYGNGLFVAVGDYGAVYYSTDGSTWTAGTGVGSGKLWGITYGNGMFVAVGNSGYNYHSTDGITWTAGTRVSQINIYDVTYGNRTFVAIGSNGEICYSTNGMTWSTITPSSQSALYGVGYGNGMFVVGGIDVCKYSKVTNARAITAVGTYINNNTQAIEDIKDRLGESNISTIGNGTVTGAISSLNTSLTNSYTTQGLTYGTNVSYVAGGYVRIGNLVIVNMRINITANLAANADLIKGLPAPATSDTVIVSVSNNKNVHTYVHYASPSYIFSSDALTNGLMMVSCVYIAR